MHSFFRFAKSLLDQRIRYDIMQNITYEKFWPIIVALKGLVHLKMKMLSSFTLVYFLWPFFYRGT